MADFIHMLEYKCAWHGIECVKVDHWHPSAKTCSACGTVKSALLLSERTDRCHTCGFDGARDLNAARNIEVFTAKRSPVADSARRCVRRTADAIRNAGEVRIQQPG